MRPTHVETLEFVKVQRISSDIPAVLYWPKSGDPQHLVLFGHTGYGHKLEPRAIETAQRLAKAFNAATLVIDGPVHGERRKDGGLDPEVIKPEWRAFWHADPHVDRMVDDWRSVLSALPKEVLELPRGYIGLSMGSLYGMPLLADAPTSFQWAILGMWGSDNHTGPRMLADAQHIDVPVIFYFRWHDQLFNLLGTLAVYDALAPGTKTLISETGPHQQPPIEAVEAWVGDLINRTSDQGAV